MEILLTNDDGYMSKGIRVLIAEMTKLGHVTVIAPDGPRSGQSNAITIHQLLRLKKVEETKDVTIYACTGTPTDCVKLGLHQVFLAKKPDLLVSGINHGSNAASDVLYSGTMGAVFEGCENGVCSIGYSLCDYSPEADFSRFAPYIVPLTKKILSSHMPYGACWNINAPVGEIKGMRLTRQCQGNWQNEVQAYVSPEGEPFYLLTGEFVSLEPKATDTDKWALSQGYISMTPTTIDTTHKEWGDWTNIGLEL